jgi:ABC-2 type transport system permease protein
MNANVIRAIFRRNFISYFSNPTGYVFICVFVLLSSMAAFWPNDFFNSNLANLDQLNKYLPFILLVFIPALTMSVWAEERRQGTDELLLTIPAADFDVVLGKYLAAVAIYTVSLAFSFLSNLAVLWWVGEPDMGLFLATYFGYWIVGLSMVAIGMVASFITGNLTVAFVLGVMFNAPLAFAAKADVIFKDPDIANAVVGVSIADQFRDFSRGVISLSSIAYFVGVMALMLYLCMVLIGRRHWRGGQEGRGVALHYLVRFLALLVVVISLDVFLSHHNRLRADISSEQLSSLAPETRQLLNKLEPKAPIKIYAYVSNEVPENYLPAKLNLLSTLSELQAVGGDKIQTYIRQIEPFSDEATAAEQQFGIRPERVEGRVRGARAPEEIFLGVAVTCGLDRVVIPFLGKGLPAEYELVRSISTVSQQKRKRVGVLTTDAKLYGGFDAQTMSPTQNQMIIDELQKQYDVVQVDPSNPIKERYDVLLAVQPSSLAPPAMENFIAAVKSGQPTAIFEDPFPYFAPDVPGTKAPKQPPGGMNPMMMGRMPPQPKGDISKLWRALGVDFNGGDVVWQNFNPYPQFRGGLPKEFVFVDEGAMAKPFNQDDPISSRLQELLFPYPGSVAGLHSSSLKFTPLVAANGETGLVPYDQIFERTIFGARMNPNLPYLERPTGDRYVLAARVTGKLKSDNLEMSDKSADDDAADDDAADEHAGHDHAGHEHASHDHADADSMGHDPTEALSKMMAEAAKSADASAAAEAPKNSDVDVVIVSDIDCLYSAFFALRARGAEEGDEVDWRFENVSFVLNVLDSLAGDDRLIEVRKHRPVHKTLTKLTHETEPLLKKADEQQQTFNKAFEKARDEAQSKFETAIGELLKKKGVDEGELADREKIARKAGEQRLNQSIERLKQERDRKVKITQREVAKTIRGVQDRYKLWGVLLPPVLPLAVAFFVFFNRRAKEREGVNKTRLRS